MLSTTAWDWISGKISDFVQLGSRFLPPVRETAHAMSYCHTLILGCRESLPRKRQRSQADLWPHC